MYLNSDIFRTSVALCLGGAAGLHRDGLDAAIDLLGGQGPGRFIEQTALLLVHQQRDDGVPPGGHDPHEAAEERFHRSIAVVREQGGQVIDHGEPAGVYAHLPVVPYRIAVIAHVAHGRGQGVDMERGIDIANTGHAFFPVGGESADGVDEHQVLEVYLVHPQQVHHVLVRSVHRNEHTIKAPLKQ